MLSSVDSNPIHNAIYSIQHSSTHNAISSVDSNYQQYAMVFHVGSKATHNVIFSRQQHNALVNK